MGKKKFLSVLVLVAFCLIALQTAGAAEKTVTLTVPGCTWAGTAARVGTILKGMSGVSKVDTDVEKHTATVTFDSEKITVEEIKKALADGGFPVEGEPAFLK